MKIDRLISIIMILLEQDKMGAGELAEMFEVSTRTIYRDIDAINLAGIPIVTFPGPGGGVGIMQSYKVEKRLFSTSDIATLLMGLGSIHSNLPSGEIVGTLAKVKGMIPKEQQNELALRSSQIKIDLTPWLHVKSLPKIMETVQYAMEHRNVLRFDYGDIRNQKSSRDMEPYRLLLKGIDWYIQGYCLLREDFRTFKLLRMANVSVLEQTFNPREIPIERLEKPLFRSEQLVTGKLRIHEEIRDLIINRFGEDCLAPDGVEHYIAEIHFPINDLSCSYLLGFGDRCVCLEPEDMRIKMRELTERIHNLYV